ncbi:hypothetical protein Gohar_000075, partial [Gossypium harknessii]|nr:hypothetical protein [Gossypium aridum]MBA0820032.1 hypothetical protein [Gossypium harknessii]
MENDLANLSLDDEEKEILQIQSAAEPVKDIYDIYLVGCFLTASVIHFPTMRSTMVNFWHP